MESGELGIVCGIWERDANPVEDLESMLFEHLIGQGHSVIILGSGQTMLGRCEISSGTVKLLENSNFPETDIDELYANHSIIEDIRRSEELLEMIKLSAYKDAEEIFEPRAKFDHYCDKAIYRAKNEVIKRTIIPRRKRIRIHGRKN